MGVLTRVVACVVAHESTIYTRTRCLSSSLLLLLPFSASLILRPLLYFSSFLLQSPALSPFVGTIPALPGIHAHGWDDDKESFYDASDAQVRKAIREALYERLCIEYRES